MIRPEKSSLRGARLVYRLVVLFLCVAGQSAGAASVIDDGPILLSSRINTGVYHGSIVVRTDVGFQIERRSAKGAPLPPMRIEHGISIAYSGSACKDCRWLQFVWRELLVTSDATTATVTVHVRTSNGRAYDISTRSSPRYHVDSGSASDPAYDAVNAAQRMAHSLVVFDAPGSFVELTPRLDRAQGVESIAHFDTYLVCEGLSIAHVGWEAVYYWTYPGQLAGPTYAATIDTARPNPQELHELAREYPTQGLLRIAALP